jgi:hypothetical protein
MNPFKLVLYSFLIFSMVIFSGCKDREITNPFDAACPKEVFTPSDFKAESAGSAIKLTWKQENTQISGFVINRNENDGTFAEVVRFDKSFSQWSDENIGTDKKYGYQLFACAGENLSNMLVAYCTPVNKTVVVTDAVSGITSTSAVFGGSATNDSGLVLTGRGVCYSTNVNPTTADNKVEMGSGSGAFNLSITGLKAGITYYVRAYASTKQGTSYGSQVTFTTSFLTVSPNSYTVPKESGSKVFTVASNIDWQVSSNQNWCTLSANSGKGNGTITATFTENKEVPQRTAILTFTGTGVANQTVSLTQAGTEPPALTITPDNQNVTNAAGSTTFNITSNVSWTATSDQTWCTITNTIGIGNATLTVNYEANTTNSQRIANLVITGLGLSAKAATVTQQSAIPTQGLVAYYPFNGNANDESGNGNNGTVNGATLTIDRKGNTNKAFEFNGASNNILALNGIIGKSFSISAWIRNISTDVNRHQIIAFGGKSPNESFFIYITNNSITCDISNVYGSFKSNSSTINEWHHCLVTSYNGFVSLYIDNTFRSSFNFPTMNIKETNLSIGSLWFNDPPLGSCWFNGKLDDIRIYNRALTEAEIQQLYNE